MFLGIPLEVVPLGMPGLSKGERFVPKPSGGCSPSFQVPSGGKKDVLTLVMFILHFYTLNVNGLKIKNVNKDYS